jgi:hypothetical protein
MRTDQIWVADLTGFEPATSALTGRRALRAAPQVRNGVSRVTLGEKGALPPFEQPFTVADRRPPPHGDFGQVSPGPPVLRQGGQQCGDAFIERLEPLGGQGADKSCGHDLVSDLLGLVVLVLDFRAVRKRR